MIPKTQNTIKELEEFYRKKHRPGSIMIGPTLKDLAEIYPRSGMKIVESLDMEFTKKKLPAKE